MKKTILNYLIIITFIVFANVHDSMAQHSNVGMKGGLNLAEFGGDAVGLKNKPGLHIGFFVTNEISETFSLQLEVIYSQQGAQFQGNSDDKFILNYVNVPIVIKAFIEEGFYLQAGPKAGILIKAKIDDGRNSEDVKDEFNDLDLGFFVGLGYKSKNNVNFDLRYNSSLTSILKEPFNSRTQINFTNSVIQFSIGSTF